MRKLLFSVSLAGFIFGLADPSVADPGEARNLSFGRVVVLALSDMERPGSTDILRGISADELKDVLPPEGFKQYIEAFLVKRGADNILIDAGLGPRNGGQAMAAMAKAGVKPDEVTLILLTHMHGDHIGGLLDASGEPVFKNAELWVDKVEADYWQSLPDDKSAAQKAVLKAYANKLRLGVPGESPALEIMAVEARGHTPGHTAYLVKSGPESILFWGDVMHVAAVQFPRPEVTVTYDVDQTAARETRERILAEVVKNGWIVAGAHLPFPAVVEVSAAGPDSYAMTPLTVK